MSDLQILKITRPEGAPRPLLCVAPDRNTKIEVLVLADHLAEFDPGTPENTNAPDGWAHVVHSTRSEGTKTPGWIEKIYLGKTFERSMGRFDLKDFVRTCCQIEITTRDRKNPGDTESPIILADYLIALALMETDLEDFETRRPGTDAIGAFQMTGDDWTSVINERPDLGLIPADRFLHISQIEAANHTAQQDWADMASRMGQILAAQDPQTVAGDSFVPSFLDLFHARLVGPEATIALNSANADDARKNEPLETVLATVLPPDVLARLLIDRKRFLTHTARATPLSVNGFFLSNSARLDERLTRAFSLIRAHFPAFVEPPAGGAAPWMEVALRELEFWSQAGTEASARGSDRIINQYFPATDHPPIATVQHWCGAFVAWCLKNSGDPEVADSVVAGAARAANWKTWGNRELRIGNLRSLTSQNADKILGAVVVFHPGSGTGTSGHVAFAVSRPNHSDKIECIGGNQSDTVKRSTFAISRIAAIRWLELGPPAIAGDATLAEIPVGTDPFGSLYEKRGPRYRRVVAYSHYNAPIEQNGQPRGRTRIYGDATHTTQRFCIDELGQAAAAKGFTVEESAMVLAIAWIESGFNPDAAAGTTSAQGLGQFIRATGEAYGLTDANRWDIVEQARALVEHTRDNYRDAHRQGLGDEFVYAKHHDGSFTNKHGGLTLARERVIPKYRAILETLRAL